MLTVGLTGGIGAGKSAVADLLVERGAVLIDADQVARDVVQPGRPAHRALIERFGSGIVAPDGAIDRPALAAVAFSDDEARSDLNRITHPAIGVEMLARQEALAGTDAIVVLAIPLLVEAKREGMDVVVVVDSPAEVALGRLVGQRGMDLADARARMAAQASREERLAAADYVVDNGGDRQQLVAEVDRLWAWLQEQPGRDTAATAAS